MFWPSFDPVSPQQFYRSWNGFWDPEALWSDRLVILLGPQQQGFWVCFQFVFSSFGRKPQIQRPFAFVFWSRSKSYLVYIIGLKHPADWGRETPEVGSIFSISWCNVWVSGTGKYGEVKSLEAGQKSYDRRSDGFCTPPACSGGTASAYSGWHTIGLWHWQWACGLWELSSSLLRSAGKSTVQWIEEINVFFCRLKRPWSMGQS